MLDTGLNMLIFDTDIKGYVCHAQKIWRMRNKPPPQSHHTGSHCLAPLNPDRGTCLKWGTLSCPLSPVGSQVLLGCYLCRQVWVHPAKKSLAVTTLNPVVMWGRDNMDFSKQKWQQNNAGLETLSRGGVGPWGGKFWCLESLKPANCRGIPSCFPDAVTAGHLKIILPARIFRALSLWQFPQKKKWTHQY